MKEYIFQPTIEQDGNAITISDAQTGLTKQNILAIINKSTKGIVHSPLVDGISTVLYSGTTMTIALKKGHESIAGNLLIKAYTDEEGSSGDAAEQVKDFFHIVKDGDTVKVITEDGGEEVVVPVELATEQEVKDINDDVMGALYGYGKVTVTIHSLMRTGAETTQDLASVIYVDPSETWAENGYPTLYDDEGEPIDTTTNPAAGDEVFNYQIQSES